MKKGEIGVLSIQVEQWSRMNAEKHVACVLKKSPICHHNRPLNQTVHRVCQQIARQEATQNHHQEALQVNQREIQQEYNQEAQQKAQQQESHQEHQQAAHQMYHLQYLLNLGHVEITIIISMGNVLTYVKRNLNVNNFVWMKNLL
mmetsp:Transcript_17216/g.20493  ORF Transcript_17216/g.20493 Transcript_17216/m.20493 type:complete len:145 (+) Transcript_17216:168-602(+)